jgi:hypothetical protein
MPDKTKSAEDSALSGLEPRTEINLIRGFKTTTRVNPIQTRASMGRISSADPASAERDPNYILIGRHPRLSVLC